MHRAHRLNPQSRAAGPARKSTHELRTALLAGASGLVGAQLLRQLLDAGEYQRTYAVSRRPLALDHARLANRIMPLEQIEARLAGLRCDDAFCCVGTTRRTAGSDEELRRVDVELVLAFARAALACGAQRFVVISSAGASARSRHVYLRTKAEMESRLTELRFASLDVMRPGLLLGWRPEVRPAELVGALVMPLVNPLLRGSLAVYRAIRVQELAAAMVGAARSQRKGVTVHAGLSLPRLARLGRRPVRSGG